MPAVQRASREEEEKARRERAFQNADERGKKASNKKWVYDPTSHRFYDNRTRKRITWDSLWNNFKSEEGWIFYEHDGSYYSVDLAATWNPDDTRGWYRRVSNFGDAFIPINYRTGFARSAKYEPATASDASHLFDELFNPVNLANSKHNPPLGNRAEILKEIAELPCNLSV